jgi:c-di-GMP-binding flagellar brake protein YcgR
MTEKKYEIERAFVRQPIPTLVDMELEDGSYRHEFSANVSAGGMYVYSEKPANAETKMTIRFALPNLDWVFEIKVKVVRNMIFSMEDRLNGKKNGMALQFLSMNDEDTQKIKSYFENFKIEDLEL